MNQEKVRVRYAPSPTGFLHIGGARSALYNYLFAKNLGGDFIVRIEDTDIERNVENGEASQLEGLEWLGIVADESPVKPNPKYAPYRQMEKLDIYQKYAQELVDKGYAYECYCTQEELEEEREAQLARGIAAPKYQRRCLHASKEQIEAWKKEGRKPTIRIKLQDHHTIKFNDLVRGEVSFNNEDIGDWVIMKSNGIPTYNFAVVVDDHLMGMTHILRGEEHLSNTPKQIQIFEYLGWEVPTYGHMTLIVNEHGKKLSKRDPSIIQFIQQYKEMGYLPEAIFNFILLLGWSPVGEKEIYSKEEAIADFDPARLSKSPSMFDPNKLRWINNQYMKKLNDEEVFNLCYPFIEKEYGNVDKEKAIKVIVSFKEQLSYGQEIVELSRPFFNKVDYASLGEEEKNTMSDASVKNTLKVFMEELDTLTEVNGDNVKAMLKQTQIKANVKGKMLFMPLRIALTGLMHGPDFTSLIQILGVDEVKERINEYLLQA